MSSFKEIDLYRDLAAVVYLSEASSPPRFFGVVYSNFVRSESVRSRDVKLLRNMVSNRTLHPPPPPSHTLYFDTGKGEGGELNQREG